MSSVFYAEMIKLKNTRIMWLVPIGAFLAAFMAYVLVVRGRTPTGVILYYRQGQILSLIVAPTLFSLVTAYVVAREYQEKTINQLFSYPVSRLRFLAAKLLVTILILSATTALSCVLTAGFTLLVANHHIDKSVVWLGIRMNVGALLLSLGVVPVPAAVSMVGKSIIPAAVLGVVVVVVNAVLWKNDSGILFPWLAPYWPVQQLFQGTTGHSGQNPYATPALAILALTFIVSLTFCFVYYARADVHSGS